MAQPVAPARIRRRCRRRWWPWPGHGLATAYYLAKEHGLRNIAVVERGWLGGGNTARNTTIVRSNYLWDDATHLYEKALQLWEGLSQDLNYNTMFSQRGVCAGPFPYRPPDRRTRRRRRRPLRPWGQIPIQDNFLSEARATPSKSGSDPN
jgi:glycine/D-amino acid oxidase-like deaminating enzyme